jgi:hypothetical protein
VAGFLASSLTTAGAGAVAVTAGVAAGLAASAAKADTADKVIRVAISDFISSFL